MKQTDNNYILIVAGGVGSRLWPLSRKSQPKQFLPLLPNGQSLFQYIAETCNQKLHIDWSKIFIVAPVELHDYIKKQAPLCQPHQIIPEPARRDNFPAITLGVTAIYNQDSQANIGLLWSDQYIENIDGLADALIHGFDMLDDHPEKLVTIGTKPTYAETGYGYIKTGRPIKRYGQARSFVVDAFKEKPDQTTAMSYVSSGDYLWNTGYKMFQAKAYLSKITDLYPELNTVIADCSAALQAGDQLALKVAYEGFPKDSIEYVYTEKISEPLVVSADMGWRDIGNWQALHQLHKDLVGEQNHPDVHLENSTNVTVWSPQKPVAIVGLSDVVVVDTKDALLIVHQNHVQDVKKIHKKLAQINPELLQ